MNATGARARGPVDRRLLRHARTSRGGVALLALIGVAQAGTTIAVAVALTDVVVAFTRDRGDAGAVAMLIGAAVARAALAWAEQVVAQRTAARVTDELRRAVLAAALRHGPAWVAGFPAGRLTALLGGGLDALRPWFGGYLPALILAVVLPPSVLATMAVVDPASALITLVTLPLVPVFGALLGWATRARAEQRWAADARLAGHFLDVVQGLATLRLYGRAQRQVAVVRAMTARHRAATMRVLRLAFLSSTALDLLATMSVGLVAVQAGLRVAAGDLGLGPALLVILVAPEALRPLREVAARYHAGVGATAVIADVDAALTAAPPQHRDDTPTIDANAANEPTIVANGLRVRHPGAVVDALAFAGLTVRGGEIVALQGPSGAGKTTLLRALAGLQPLRGGAVRVTGPRPLYLPQRPTLPHARTIREALAHLPTDADAALLDALHTVGLDAEVTALPSGLETPLGAHGQGVSSGQRQRLALAQILAQARREPVVLLLDEPTAHLDPAREAVVVAELRAAADRGCAVLVTAHRPALLNAADRIVPVTADRIVPVTADRPVPATTVPSLSAPADMTARDQLWQQSPTTRPRLQSPDLRRSRWGSSVGVAALLGAGAWLSGIVLTGAAGWLLTRAAALPPVLTLSMAVVLVRASAIARPLLRYLERLVSHEVALRRLGSRRATVYASLIPRVPGVSFHRGGELLTRVVDDVDARIDGLLRGRLPVASAGLALVTGLAAATAIAPSVGLVLLVGLMVSAVFAPGLAGRHAHRLDAATSAATVAMRDAVVDTIDGLEELASRDGAVALSVPDRCSRALSRIEARVARSAGAATALAHLGWGGTVAVTAAVLGTAGLAPTTAAVLLLTTVAVGEAVLVLPDTAVARRRAAGASTRLTALTTPENAESMSKMTKTTESGLGTRAQSAQLRPAAGARGNLAVRGLVAGWDPGREPALRGVDLIVPAGARVAIVGPSGCGKSTLAAVLVRLLAPREGTITLDGTGDLTPHGRTSTGDATSPGTRSPDAADRSSQIPQNCIFSLNKPAIPVG